MGTEHDILQVESDADERVLAAFTPRARSARPGTPTAAEERLEDVAEPAEAARSPAERRAVAAQVVPLPLLGVAQHVVGVRHELEAFGCLFARVHVGVQLPRESAVGLLDLVG